MSRRAAVVLTTALLVPALPSLAAPTAVTQVVPPVLREAPLAGGATVTALTDEQLLGVTWDRGSPAPRVAVRWRTASGWGAWDVPDLDSDEPDAAERAHTRGGTEPLWRPAGASAADVRITGAARGLRLVRVADGVPRRVGGGLRLGLPAAHADARSAGVALLGGVHSRADWGADESIRSGSPSYASRVDAVVVHHTAGSNDYTQADVPRRIRADYAYHVKSRGWSDLGYNLVVDKFGGIWEGRAGGLGRATIGSHAQGFNTRTLGVSLLGDMTRATPTPAALSAFDRVGAYAALTWRFDPRTSVTLTSGGSPRFRSGARVTLPRVFGHKDTGQTACPGVLYDHLAQIRTDANALLGPAPRITDVQLSGAPVRAPQQFVLRGELTRSAPWTAALRDSDGVVVARSAGEGPTATLTWDGLRPLVDDSPGVLPALPGSYTWAVRVDDGVHVADRREGPFEVDLPLVPALG